MWTNRRLAIVLMIILSFSGPASAMTAEEQESIFWQQFGFGMAGGLITAGGAAFGVYYLCDSNDVDWDSGSGTICFAGLILAGVLGLMVGTATTVWGVGELYGLDGSWASTFGGAAIGTLLSAPLAPLAPVGAAVGATYFYKNSHSNRQLEPGPAMETIPQTILPLFRLSF